MKPSFARRCPGCGILFNNDDDLELMKLLVDADVRIAKLKREVEVLRRYGNKDCIAMADDFLRTTKEEGAQ